MREGTNLMSKANDGMAEPDPESALRVLLVEDDGLIRMTTARLLKEFGHLVHEARDAEEALALLEDWPIHLMITDVNLPGSSGLELARRATRRRPTLRILFATGARQSELRLPPGGLVLTKPYGATELRSAIKKAAWL